MSSHALLSPSSADRWMLCPGSVAFCKDMPDTGSAFADEGTAAHWVAAECLASETPVSRYAGLQVAVTDDYVGLAQLAPIEAGVLTQDNLWLVNDEMVDAVTTYVTAVRAAAGQGNLLVEQRLPITQLTGEPDASGTSDAVVFTGTEMQIHDLKYGRGVEVAAENNRQMQIYALAALDEYSDFFDVETIKVFIHQPRIAREASVWEVSRADLEAFRNAVKLAAASAQLAGAPRVPGDKQCKWCRGKATCPELAALVQEQVGAAFEDITEETAAFKAADQHPGVSADALGAKMAAVPLIEQWCTAVRAETERRLFAKAPVPGYKLVQGKKGNRAWSDEAVAEAAMKSMRLKHDEMYSYKVISPTVAEKLLKESPRRWAKLEALITQSDGKPSVAPESDKRPALVLDVADQFEDLS